MLFVYNKTEEETSAPPFLLLIIEDCFIELCDENKIGKDFTFEIKFKSCVFSGSQHEKLILNSKKKLNFYRFYRKSMKNRLKIPKIIRFFSRTARSFIFAADSFKSLGRWVSLLTISPIDYIQLSKQSFHEQIEQTQKKAMRDWFLYILHIFTVIFWLIDYKSYIFNVFCFVLQLEFPWIYRFFRKKSRNFIKNFQTMLRYSDVAPCLP